MYDLINFVMSTTCADLNFIVQKVTRLAEKWLSENSKNIKSPSLSTAFTSMVDPDGKICTTYSLTIFFETR